MFNLRKCCCCSLKYGVFTFTIINLIIRVCCATILWFRGAYFFDDHSESSMDTAYGFGLGWHIATAAISYVALKGVVQKNSILLYPLIVVLVLELVLSVLVSSYLSISLSAYYLVDLCIGLVVYGFYIICLISLYRQIKQNEKNRHINPINPPHVLPI